MFYVKVALSVILADLLAVTAELKVPKKRPFGKRVKVEFTVDNATKDDYIGIYRYKKGDPLDINPFSESLQYYVYLCNSQDRVTCDAVENGSGSVSFDGVDPTEEYNDQWPLNPRKYKVCHMRQGEDSNEDETGELIQDCKEMKVRISESKKEKVKNKAFVKAVKNTYKFEETIKADFNLGFKSPNSWVGIYTLDDLENEIMWVYTGCNNVLGDQVVTGGESNDCNEKRRKGQVKFDESNTGRAPQDWPLPVGEYALKMQYYNNPPHNLFKQAEETFSVV